MDYILVYKIFQETFLFILLKFNLSNSSKNSKFNFLLIYENKLLHI